jgi:signal transduction histidine kinase
MEKLSKQFAESVTKWKTNNQADEFFKARLRLTFYYSLTAIVILGGSSIILYNTILLNFSQSILQDRRIDPAISKIIIDRTQDILLNRFLTIDIVLMFFIIVLGFFLTHKTLKPIKFNMQKQKRFIADASHELRTPTAVVISGLEVALSNKKLDFSSAKKTLEDTLDEIRELSELSNNLLDISKYDMPSENTKYEPIQIDEKIKRIVEKNKILAKLKEINIETKIQSEAIILGNKIELSRVFYNILDNAIKYTPYKGKITVTGKIKSNKYIITTRDNGSGISKEAIDKIFDPFFRGDKARTTNGAGLGLTLSKRIIESHKGTIEIKSEENKGTNVIISLPLAS